MWTQRKRGTERLLHISHHFFLPTKASTQIIHIHQRTCTCPYIHAHTSTYIHTRMNNQLMDRDIGDFDFPNVHARAGSNTEVWGEIIRTHKKVNN